MSIKKTGKNYDYGYTSISSVSSSNSSKTMAKPATLQASSLAWLPQQPQQYHSPINEYENATPNFLDPCGYEDVPSPSPSTAELSNASSYIAYLVEQLNKAKDKLEKAEEKIKILESKDGSFEQYKEYLIESIDKFLVGKVGEESISGKEIFEQATK